ncbi:MAG: glycine zipper domain-containing protein [Rubripirellula sp.]
MSRTTFCFLAIALMASSPNIANAQVRTQRGATLGGLAGAVAGGLIGDNNGEAGAGAAIGGVVGAVAGGLLGNAADKEAVYQRQQNVYYQQQQQTQQFAQTQSAVSIADAISMTRSGLGDSVIINQINQRGVQQQLQVSDIITLHQQGVRESVITAMQRSPTGVQRVARAAPQPVQRVITRPAPVIVEEHYVVPHYAPPRYYHRRPVHHHQSGFHIRF